MAREIFDRRIPSFNSESGRLANNPPEVPPTKLRRLEPLAVCISKACGKTPDENATVSKTLIEDPFRGSIKALKITPLTPQPLIPFKTIGVAGIRTIGGGTSRESIKRAKKKSKKTYK